MATIICPNCGSSDEARAYGGGLCVCSACGHEFDLAETVTADEPVPESAVAAKRPTLRRGKKS